MAEYRTGRGREKYSLNPYRTVFQQISIGLQPKPESHGAGSMLKVPADVTKVRMAKKRTYEEIEYSKDAGKTCSSGRGIHSDAEDFYSNQATSQDVGCCIIDG